MKKAIKFIAIILSVLTVGIGVTAFTTPQNNQVVEAAVYTQGSRGQVVRTIQQKLKNVLT